MSTTKSSCGHYVTEFMSRSARTRIQHFDGALHVVEQFVEHYNLERSHYGLELDTPLPNNVIPLGTESVLQRNDRLGGLLHAYDIVAA